MTKKVEHHYECQFCNSRSKSLFCNLNIEELQYLNVSKECQVFKKGQVIFNEGVRPYGLYCINSGKIKAVKLGEEGREHILHLSKEGDILGYRAILGGDVYSCSAVVIEDASVCFIPKEVFFSMVEQNPNLSLQVIKMLSGELKTAEKSITDIAQKPVRERLAEALLLLKDVYGSESDEATLNVNMSREEIANIVGTATETTIRLLSEFKNEKIIELHKKKIKILDLNRLVKTANVND